MTDRQETLRVPAEFFSDVVPLCRDSAELKAVLLVVECAARSSGPLVPLDSLLLPPFPARVVGLDSPVPAGERLVRVLERAVAAGALLRVSTGNGDLQTISYLVATRSNRELADRLRRGDHSAARRMRVPAGTRADISRPNAFALFERHIGPLTPIVAERLRDAEEMYPREWLEEAIESAARNNRRNWRYIETLLSQWEGHT